MNKPKLHLIFQGSIPVSEPAAGEALYNELKIFLQVYSKKVTLDGRIQQALEHCCDERKEPKPNE